MVGRRTRRPPLSALWRMHSCSRFALRCFYQEFQARAGVHACACGSDLFSVSACVAAFALRCYCWEVKITNKRLVSRCACGYCIGGRGSARGWAWHPLAPMHSGSCSYITRCTGRRRSAPEISGEFRRISGDFRCPGPGASGGRTGARAGRARRPAGGRRCPGSPEGSGGFRSCPGPGPARGRIPFTYRGRTLLVCKGEPRCPGPAGRWPPVPGVSGGLRRFPEPPGPGPGHGGGPGSLVKETTSTVKGVR